MAVYGFQRLGDGIERLASARRPKEDAIKWCRCKLIFRFRHKAFRSFPDFAGRKECLKEVGHTLEHVRVFNVVKRGYQISSRDLVVRHIYPRVGIGILLQITTVSVVEASGVRDVSSAAFICDD